MTSSGTSPATSRFVAQCVNQELHGVLQQYQQGKAELLWDKFLSFRFVNYVSHRKRPRIEPGISAWIGRRLTAWARVRPSCNSWSLHFTKLIWNMTVILCINQRISFFRLSCIFLKCFTYPEPLNSNQFFVLGILLAGISNLRSCLKETNFITKKTIWIFVTQPNFQCFWM
jgi:hypothetical protein